MDDIRILSPAGVERAAQGWDRHARLQGLQGIHEAEKAALHEIEKTTGWRLKRDADVGDLWWSNKRLGWMVAV